MVCTGTANYLQHHTDEQEQDAHLQGALDFVHAPESLVQVLKNRQCVSNTDSKLFLLDAAKGHNGRVAAGLNVLLKRRGGKYVRGKGRATSFWTSSQNLFLELLSDEDLLPGSLLA